MRCPNCKKETDNNSKFCSNCGEKVEITESLDSLDNIIKMCSQACFTLGYMRGMNIGDKKALEKIERHLKSGSSELWEIYCELVNYIEKSDKKLKEKTLNLNQSPNSES